MTFRVAMLLGQAINCLSLVQRKAKGRKNPPTNCLGCLLSVLLAVNVNKCLEQSFAI